MSTEKAYKPTHGGFPGSVPAHKQTNPDKKPGQIVNRPYDNEFPEPVSAAFSIKDALVSWARKLVRSVIKPWSQS